MVDEGKSKKDSKESQPFKEQIKKHSRQWEQHMQSLQSKKEATALQDPKEGQGDQSRIMKAREQ